MEHCVKEKERIIQELEEELREEVQYIFKKLTLQLKLSDNIN